MEEDPIILAARIAALSRPISRRRLLSFSGAIGMATVGLAGCSQPAAPAPTAAPAKPAPAATQPPAAAAAPRIAAKVNLGTFNSINPLNLAKASQAYEKLWGSGSELKWMIVDSGGQAIQAMASNNIDLCYVGSSPMAVGLVNGAPISMVYVAKYITDNEGLVVRTDRGISTVKDLKGKKVGTPFNSSSHFALLSVIKKAGMAPSDAQIINMPPDQISAAWQRGEIDAFYVWEPAVTQAVATGGKVITVTGDLVNDGTMVFDGIVVRNDFKKSNSDTVLAYLKEYDRVAQMFVTKPDEVADMMSEYMQLPIETAKQGVKGIHPLTPKEQGDVKWMGLGKVEQGGVNKALIQQAQFLKDQGSIPNVPASFSQYIDTSFLEKMM